MTGLHVGRLNVYTTDLHGNETLIWRLFGDQNNTWKEGHAPVNLTRAQYQVNMAFYRLILCSECESFVYASFDIFNLISFLSYFSQKNNY